MGWTYVVMHLRREVAEICEDGQCRILEPDFLPYNLYLEEDSDLDARINNLSNFYYWCATRVLPVDRTFVKEILNAVGAGQGTTDRDRARIALSYHCVTLTDVFWVKKAGESVCFEDINLYEQSLSDAFVGVSLFGRSLTLENEKLLRWEDTAGDISTRGAVPKAWIKRDGIFYLLKDGGIRDVEAELRASRIIRCFKIDQVYYEPYEFEGASVSISRLITSLDKSIVPMEFTEIYALNHDTSRVEMIEKYDLYGFHMMNIVDYLVGNTDRHWGNWGFEIDNRTNLPTKLHALMDFNKAFLGYDHLEGARCMTTTDRVSQMEAALRGVHCVGLNQTGEVKREWFSCEAEWQMFNRRLEVLRSQLYGT